MLGLKLVTDPRWVNIVESNIEEILTDHAWCEQKAASNAISLITYNSELEELVTELLVAT
jgi:tRNA-(ms[2]io[6]A)-hydroxylase